MMIMGTSAGLMALGKEKCQVPGTAASMYHGHYPGYWSYVSSQPSVGDCFQWFVDRCVPEAYAIKAKAKGMDLHRYLSELASEQKPGQTGLLALDWFNGGSSLLGSSNLSGLILGLSLHTKPEEIYRALLEATAYGARRIMENYIASGVDVEEVVVCGGIPGKNSMMMQIYADILGKPLRVSLCTQAAALGSAIYAAGAAGEKTGFASVTDAVKVMGCKAFITYFPIAEHMTIYERLYEEYCRLQSIFAHEDSVMERLADMKKS